MLSSAKVLAPVASLLWPTVIQAGFDRGRMKVRGDLRGLAKMAGKFGATLQNVPEARGSGLFSLGVPPLQPVLPKITGPITVSDSQRIPGGGIVNPYIRSDHSSGLQCANMCADVTSCACRMSIVQGDSAAVCPSAALAFSYDVDLQARSCLLLSIGRILPSKSHAGNFPVNGAGRSGKTSYSV